MSQFTQQKNTQKVDKGSHGIILVFSQVKALKCTYMIKQ